MSNDNTYSKEEIIQFIMSRVEGNSPEQLFEHTKRVQDNITITLKSHANNEDSTDFLTRNMKDSLFSINRSGKKDAFIFVGAGSQAASFEIDHKDYKPARYKNSKFTIKTTSGNYVDISFI